jgi:hypothetical protein
MNKRAILGWLLLGSFIYLFVSQIGFVMHEFLDIVKAALHV